MLFIAHQGTRIYAPENSIQGYYIAAEMGYYALNFAQVRASKDGTLYIMHDSTVDRTTDGTGAIAELSDAEISEIRLDFAEDYAEYKISDYTYDDLRIPSLDEAVAICVEKNVVPMIRLGIKPEGNEKAFENLNSIIEKYGIADNFILSGPIETMHYLDPQYPSTMKVVFSKTANVDEMISLFDQYTWIDKSTVYAMIKPCFLLKDDLKRIKNAGYGAYAANPGDMRNPEEAMSVFIRLEQDGCEFVNAERFVQVRK